MFEIDAIMIVVGIVIALTSLITAGAAKNTSVQVGAGLGFWIGVSVILGGIIHPYVAGALVGLIVTTGVTRWEEMKFRAGLQNIELDMKMFRKNIRRAFK